MISQFPTKETDPASEARERIWDDFAGFARKSNHLADVAGSASRDIKTVDDVRVALKSIGSACQACHKEYRK